VNDCVRIVGVRTLAAEPGTDGTTARASAARWVCPVDHGRLEAGNGEMRCPACGLAARVAHGVVDFSPASAAPQRWREAQHYEIDFWTHDAVPMEARAEMYRANAAGIMRFFAGDRPIDARSRVVQIGAAGHAEINYITAGVKCAVDPLAAALSERGLLVHGDVHWASAMGEQLPCANGAFTHAILANMIDHVSDPRKVLCEALRVLEPGGVACVSCHVSRRAMLPFFRLLSKLKFSYFRGHLWFFDERSLDGLCQDAGFNLRAGATDKGSIGWQGWQGSVRRSVKPMLVAPRWLQLRKSI
jgi:SAM-dependent methyltransferase